MQVEAGSTISGTRAHFPSKRLGILALQGGFQRHSEHAGLLGIEPLLVKYPEQLSEIDALLLPGGESTTLGKLLERNNFLQPLRNLIAGGLPVLATCAGTILLADDIVGSDQVRIGGLPIRVQRNAYGPQVFSFETSLEIKEPVPFVTDVLFIRAPIIEKISPTVRILAEFENFPVAIAYKSVIACTFHFEYARTPSFLANFLENYVISR